MSTAPQSASADAFASLSAYRDRHRAETVIVCGCGPSLTKLAEPKRFITIGVNDVGRLFDPTYLVVVNPRQQFAPGRFRYVEESGAKALFTQLALGAVQPPVVRIQLGRYGGTDLEQVETQGLLHYTQNSPYVALCLAAYMGARRIGLIGVDFTGHHFFADTGTYPLSSQVRLIDEQYQALYAALRTRSIEIFNLSEPSLLSAFPKVSQETFFAAEQGATAPFASARKMSVVSYATTPVAGVPAILARCIRARTDCDACCVWERGGYGNGVYFDSDDTIEWSLRPEEAQAAIRDADVLVVHNGKVDARHRRWIEGKPVITMAHNYMWNVDPAFVKAGYPGVVVGQYQATLAEFTGWSAVPNPIPLWEDAFRTGPKGSLITIAYTPSGKHERYPDSHRLYWHGKGYDSTMRILDALARRYPVSIEAVRERQLSHAEALKAKQGAHIVIDECVTGSYHRNSLEGLAMGCVVINGVGLLPPVADVLRACNRGGAPAPFTFASLNSLEATLEALLGSGSGALATQGQSNRRWMEDNWQFDWQWEHFWQPAIERAIERARRLGARAPTLPARSGAAPHHAGGSHVQLSRSPPAKPGVCVVMPHAGEERLPHLAASLENLSASAGIDEIVVAEMGHAPVADALSRRWGAKYVFIRNNDVFERARSLNAGSALARCPLILWKDNDLLMPSCFVETAARELNTLGADYLIPYASIGYLSESDSRAVMSGGRHPSACAPIKTWLAGRHISGGAGLVTRAFLERVGGVPEIFRGWGGEDNAWLHKASLLGQCRLTAEREQALFHLYHPHSGTQDTPAYLGNPYYQENVASLMQMRRVRNGAEFLRRYPAATLRHPPWGPDKRIGFVLPSDDSSLRHFAQRAATGLRARFATDIVTIEANGDGAWLRALSSYALDAVVLFGTRLALRALELADFAQWQEKSLVVLDDAEGLSDTEIEPLQKSITLAAAGEAAAGVARRLKPAVNCFPLVAEQAAPEDAALDIAQPLSIVVGTAIRPRLKAARNVFACLVHEHQDTVIDLVRNLRYHDPSSTILLYNGGADLSLLDRRFPFERYGAIVHPAPRPMRWGHLHQFALDAMSFAIDNLNFDTLTIVDSDQLAMRPGYSAYLGAYLATRDGVGLLCNASHVQRNGTRIAPAEHAWREVDLWRPFLSRFASGEQHYVHWAFWPSTVFTRDAARDLVRMFATDAQLHDILRRTKIWATEEIILPTLVALMGYKIESNPCSYDFVKFREIYSRQQLDEAFSKRDVFWIHPVARRYGDPNREIIRARCNHYETKMSAHLATAHPDANDLLLTVPILERMRQIEGWLEDDEADLLIAAAARAIASLPEPFAIVEVGSYCGRSTVVLASVAKRGARQGSVWAIDPHDGQVGALDQGVQQGEPTLERIRANLASAGVDDVVEIVQKRSYEVEWDRPISFLLIDGLHDYANVARDFFHFEKWMTPGGYVAFHDYADYYPGVQVFVNELLHSEKYRKVACARSLMVIQRIDGV